jgi:hypothetical protein
MPDEEANIFKVPYLNGRYVRICGGHKREGGCALPGEASCHAIVLLSLRRGRMCHEESAEAIVVRTTTGEGPNFKLRTESLAVRVTGDIGGCTEMHSADVADFGRKSRETA